MPGIAFIAVAVIDARSRSAARKRVWCDRSPVSAAVGLACAMSFEITTLEPDDHELELRAARRREITPLLDILQLDAADYHAIVEASTVRFGEVSEQYG